MVNRGNRNRKFKFAIPPPIRMYEINLQLNNTIGSHSSNKYEASRQAMTTLIIYAHYAPYPKLITLFWSKPQVSD